MTDFKPSPKQALFLWRMITGETPEICEPSLSNAKPALKVKKERQPLVDHAFLKMEKRGSSTHLILQQKAWDWAGQDFQVELMMSRSAEGARALQGLLRKLIPFLDQQGIPLKKLCGEQQPAASVEAPQDADEPSEPAALSSDLAMRVRNACLFLAQGRTKERVRLCQLRVRLADLGKEELDHTLIALQRSGEVVLYRDDNSAALSRDDNEAALYVGGSPRHLVYLEE